MIQTLLNYGRHTGAVGLLIPDRPYLAFRPEYWRANANAFYSFAEVLSQESIFCVRNPAKLALMPGYRDFSGRIVRCLALGQHLERLTSPNRDDGQFGLYGTAAGLELMATTAEAQTFTKRGPLTHGEMEWASHFLATWNFFDLAITELSEIPASKFWDQTRTTLRVCNLVRALAVAKPVFTSFADPARRAKAGCSSAVVADLREDFSEAAVDRIGDVLLGRLRSARVLCREVPRAFRVSKRDEESTFRFACESTDVPVTWRDWLFVWSSVLTAVLFAYGAGVWDMSQITQLVTLDDVEQIIEMLWNSRFADDRYRLYALAALDPLTRGHHAVPGTTPQRDDTEVRIPTQFALGHAENRWLEKEVVLTCGRLLNSEVQLVDVHSPYQIWFGDPSKAERYRDEYYVVPVLPVVMDLIARHAPHWIFRPRLRRILQCWVEPPKDSDVAILPFQVGQYNGTVNALYYRHAALSVGSALSRKSTLAWLHLAVGIWRDHPRVAVVSFLAIGVAISTTLLFSYGKPDKMVVGFFLGVLASFVANLLTPQLVKWLWERK